MLRLAVLLVAACAAPRVPLPPLATGGTPRERLDRYQAYAPVATQERALIRRSTGEVVQRSTTFLLMRDGRRVRNPIDLVPAVGEDSPSGRAARRAQRSGERSKTWYAIGAGVELLALGFLATAVASDLDEVPMLVGGGTLFVGGLTSFFVGLHHEQEASEQRAVSFRLYEPDLRERLDLCVDGLRIVACEDLTP